MRLTFSALSSLLLLVLLGSNGALAQLSCYSCDSDSDANCATFKVAPISAVCEEEETECAVSIVGRRTIRGCKSAVEETLNAECSDTSCGLCESDLCNTMIWPENRLLCHKCTTCDYINNNANLEVCENYLSGDSCYVVADQVANPETSNVDIISYRGCFSSGGEGVSYCLSHPDTCLPCSTAGCNSAPTYSESTLTCYKCDTATDPNCVVGQVEAENESQLCEYNKFLGAAESCYTYKSENGEVSRGCLLELPATSAIRVQCEANDEKCETCSMPDCNKATTEEDYGTCVVCDGSEDPNCALLTEGYTVLKCGPHETGGCIMANIYGMIIRSCVSELTSAGELQMCQEGELCKICHGDLCNAKVDYSVCHQCDSRTDPNCVDYQSSNSVTCTDYLDTCAAYIDFETGATIRGCTKQLPNYYGCSSGANYCVDCDRHYCNAAPIPYWRVRCHQCEGLDCAIVALDTINYCSNYKDEEECYSVSATVEGETKVYRGCMSDAETDPGKELCAAEGDNCAKCTRTECNSLSYSFTSELTCHVCDSTIDSSCSADKSTALATQCGYELGVGKTDQCYQYFDGSVLNRGCFYNAPADIQTKCANGDANCKLCGENGCNSDEYETYGQCYFCTGGSACQTLTGIVPIYCPVGNRQGCFRSQVDGRIVRGCISQLQSSEIALCERGDECKLCEGENCNGKINYQSCYSCNSAQDANCGLFSATNPPTKTVCSDYLDKCVTYFENGVVYRGCEKESNVECPSGSCVACTADDCNTQPPITPSQLSCHVCDSTTDPYCYLDQSTYQTAVCDYSLIVGNADSCYQHFDGEKVSRGCLHNAPFEIQVKCLGGDAECSVCGAAGCNSQGVENNGLCYYCDGTVDSNCESLTGVSAIHCPAGDRKGCFRSQIDGFVVRGCISQLQAGEVAVCQAGRTCKVCEGDNCNGKLTYQSCYSCNSADDPSCGSFTPTEDSSKTTCSAYIDECVTYYENGVVYRGCHKDADVTCPSGSCVACTGNDCNTQPPITPSELHCHQCDAATDINCSGAQSSSQSTRCDYSLIVGNADQCYSYFDGVKLSRGCVYNAPFDIQVKCLGGEAECQLCGTTGCNSASIETNGQCYHCDGTEDSNCASLNGILPILCPKGDRKGCFRSEVDGYVVRGCLSQLHPGELSLCERGRECKICEGDNCNAKIDYQTCYTCDSASDPNCIEVQNSATSAKTICSDYLDECVTYIDNGITYRGCRKQSTLPSTCPSATCAFCESGECNGLVYPSNRIRCHQCSGTDPNCFSNLNLAHKLCKNYVAGDSCYTTIATDRSSVYRGCMSDADTGSQLCSTNGDSCARCLITGCNTDPAMSGASLSCVTCSSSDENCSWGYGATEAELCKADIWLGQTESCYRVQSADGATERGCTMDNVNKCPANGVECETCTSDACNVKSYNKHKCYQCDSTLAGQQTCAEKAEDLLITDCPGDDQKLTDVGCYLWKKEDGSVVRGCAKDLDATLTAVCKSEDDDVCQYCDSDGCNDQDAGAAELKALSVIALVVIACLKVVLY